MALRPKSLPSFKLFASEPLFHCPPTPCVDGSAPRFGPPTPCVDDDLATPLVSVVGEAPRFEGVVGDAPRLDGVVGDGSSIRGITNDAPPLATSSSSDVPPPLASTSSSTCNLSPASYPPLKEQYFVPIQKPIQCEQRSVFMSDFLDNSSQSLPSHLALSQSGRPSCVPRRSSTPHDGFSMVSDSICCS